MAEKDIKHKLTTIFYADVVGYSRLTENDEIGTHRIVMAALDFATKSIKEMDGEVLRYAGDAILAEFASVSRAVDTAVTIQKQLMQQNSDVSENKQVQIRIGLNIGEVIIDRGEIYGSGVNLAARLESVAYVSSICISSGLFEQIKGKSDHLFVDGGLVELKNIAEPAQIYHWQESAHTDREDELSKDSTSNSEKPTLAVLPFDNMSADPEQEYFSDGITEDIITDLSKVSACLLSLEILHSPSKGKW